MILPKRFYSLVLMAALSASLAACAGGEAPVTDSAVSTAGASTPSLSSAERQYRANSADVTAALQYAAALNAADEAERAAITLAPFANDSSSPAAVKAEFANIQLSLDNNVAAQQYAQKAIKQDPKLGVAYQYLGAALEAQGKPKDAEPAYRDALTNWQGDSTGIMTSLALNLASQKKLDEAIDIMYQAKDKAPQNSDVERNFRIVLALQQAKRGDVPKPPEKPRT